MSRIVVVRAKQVSYLAIDITVFELLYIQSLCIARQPFRAVLPCVEPGTGRARVRVRSVCTVRTPSVEVHIRRRIRNDITHVHSRRPASRGGVAEYRVTMRDLCPAGMPGNDDLAHLRVSAVTHVVFDQRVEYIERAQRRWPDCIETAHPR